MLLLLIAAAVWVVVHVGIAGTAVRGAIAARTGEAGFRIGYSLLSFAAIALLVQAWQGAETTPLWFAPPALRWVLAVVMLAAVILFVASVARSNPTAMGGEAALGQEARGITRITRHPMLWSFALWAGIHILGNGDTASLVFFGAFLVTALVGMPSIDVKLAARAPGPWAKLAAETSILPFAAIAAGRNRLALAEIGWVPPVVGLLAWAVLLHFHASVFGVPALLIAP